MSDRTREKWMKAASEKAIRKRFNFVEKMFGHRRTRKTDRCETAALTPQPK